MIPGPEAAALTGHPVGGITPLCLAAPLQVFFDVQLQRFDEVVTAAGATHSAIRIPPHRLAELVDAIWVDICSEL
jgi:prolyl-tRNA editing enzyme YbaK/EbsC (Cys-tRNA(Pro) deacylase)